MPNVSKPDYWIGRSVRLVLDKPLDQRGKRRFVAVKAGDHRVKEGLGVEVLKIDRVSSLIRQQEEERQLGTAIALAERMNDVEFGEEVGRLLSELLHLQPGQKFVFLQLPEQQVRLIFDAFRKSERVPALGHANGSDLPGPVVDVLKQVPVNRLEMREIQITGREFFIGPGVAYFRFECVELIGVGKIELVFQDGGAGIAVVIGDCIVHPGLCLPVGLDDRFPALLMPQVSLGIN
ncbi:hypothetical protein [Bradyrhizobium japonicum]|uniref:hypothetical protein n=1 Tax=Bradyrhizobium japonicum TaxID=375 RepID=UPI003D9B1E42